MLKYIRRQGWHATCRVKANRNLNDRRIDQLALAQRHRRYVRVHIPAADGSKTTYLVRPLVGRPSNVPFDVRGLVSRRHYRDPFPVYFISTDLSLAPHTALQWYAKRWNCELDNTYLKLRLGLGDFRLQPYEAIDKFCTVVHLAWAYAQWRLALVEDTCESQRTTGSANPREAATCRQYNLECASTVPPKLESRESPLQASAAGHTPARHQKQVVRG
jgi:hypothetical protein